MLPGRGYTTQVMDTVQHNIIVFYNTKGMVTYLGFILWCSVEVVMQIFYKHESTSKVFRH